jgi:hypothetical protein
VILGGAATVALAVTFGQPSAVAGDEVTVRASSFRGTNAVYLYLVPRADRARIRSALDRRLVFAVRLKPRRGRAAATFAVPPIASGSYVAWCRGCNARTRVPLTVTMPAATADACPVTIPKSGPPPGLTGVFHGNGVLWVSLPAEGVAALRDGDGDGLLGTKIFWYAAGMDGVFSVSGRRLDASSSPVVVHSVNRGTQSGFRGTGTWASAVGFATPGCWKFTARLRGFEAAVAVDLSFVMKVEQA